MKALSHRCIGITALLWVSLLFAAQPSTAATDDAVLEKNRKANGECFSCHSEAGMKKPPRAGLDLAKLLDSALEPEKYNRSNHGHMACGQCHDQGYEHIVHPGVGKSVTSDCTECHAAKVLRLEPQFNASVHARREQVKEKFTCSTCHDPHTAISAAVLGDPRKIVAQDNHDCLQCHNSDLAFARFAPDGEKTPGIRRGRPDIDRIHDWLPNTKLHWSAVRCVECHTPRSRLERCCRTRSWPRTRHSTTAWACHSRNSSLTTRLYRHLVKDEQQKLGFTNSVILSNAYVIGATRHPLIDRTVIALAIATALGVLAHGLIRLVLARRRRKGTQDE